MRQVIDVSGDGISRHGRSVAQARDEAVARGITINGLPIRLKNPEAPFEKMTLDDHYRQCVIGGQEAFIVPVYDRQQMAEAIRTKIAREIAYAPAQSLIQNVQVETQVNCQEGISQHNSSR